MSNAVEFPGHAGVVLRGELHLPDGNGPHPAVAMAHGFSAVIDMALDAYAAAIAAAGVAVLMYDHRGFGRSDGTPRQEINPWAQARDFRRALDWLERRDDIDPGRLGLWGSSFSGGQVLVVGAVDDRVRAVVANVPFAGLGATYPDPHDVFARMRGQLLDESGSGFADLAGEALGPMAVVREPGSTAEPFLAQDESAEWFLSYRDTTPWQNEVTLKHAFGTDPPFDPALGAVHLETTPVLFVLATEDRVAPVELAEAVFDSIRGPKQRLDIAGHHFVPYRGDALDQSAAAAARFFADRL